MKNVFFLCPFLLFILAINICLTTVPPVEVEVTKSTVLFLCYPNQDVYSKVNVFLLLFVQSSTENHTKREFCAKETLEDIHLN